MSRLRAWIQKGHCIYCSVLNSGMLWSCLFSSFNQLIPLASKHQPTVALELQDATSPAINMVLAQQLKTQRRLPGHTPMWQPAPTHALTVASSTKLGCCENDHGGVVSSNANTCEITKRRPNTTSTKHLIEKSCGGSRPRHSAERKGFHLHARQWPDALKWRPP